MVKEMYTHTHIHTHMRTYTHTHILAHIHTTNVCTHMRANRCLLCPLGTFRNSTMPFCENCPNGTSLARALSLSLSLSRALALALAFAQALSLTHRY